MKTITDTPELVTKTVLDSKVKAAKIKHLKDAMIEIAPLFKVMREVKALKSRIKGYAVDAGITSYEIEEPNRVVLRFVKGSPNAIKANLLLALTAVLGDEAEAQKFLDELMKVVHSEGKKQGETVLSFKDRVGYLNVGER